MVRIMASAKDNRGGRVWSPEEERTERGAEAFGCTSVCPVTLQRPPCPSAPASNTVPISAVHVSNQKMFALWTANQKHNNPEAQAVRGCAAKASIFLHVPQRVFQNPMHASTMKQVGDGSTGGNNFGSARSVLSRR